MYIANGSGSGSWTISEAVVTGMIADFATPLAPTGWLECDGSDVSTITYNALYTAMTIQQTGSRGIGSAIITGLTSTTNMKAGYYVFGTGIASGTTISSVDSATQITLSGTVGSSGSSTVIVSPWLLNTGTIRVPNCTTAGRFRRSRTSSTIVGTLQADQNSAHTHAISGTTSAGSSHVHGITSQPVSGTITLDVGGSGTYKVAKGALNISPGANNDAYILDAAPTATHSLTTSGTTDAEASHTHPVSFTSASSGSTEARPLALIVITCVKT